MTRLSAELLGTTLLCSLLAAPLYAQGNTAPTPPNAGNTTTATQSATDTSPTPASNAAAAVGATADDDVIVVTGSRISRPDLEASSPVSVLSREAFKQTNTVTVEALLQQNPQFLPAESGSSNNPGNGVATVDLRGLGPQRTLVLVDGKRLVPYDTNGVVDLNIIPVALLKRVDILTGGASAVYGSDAISGVVNFILDDRFEGLRADASSSVTTRGDGAQYDVSLTGGLKLGERGNFVISGNYSKRQGVTQGARGFSRQNLDSSDLSPSGSSNADPTVFDNTFNLGATAPASGFYQLAPNNDLVDFYAPYNFNPPNYFQSPFERYGVTALARYELTDHVEAFARGTYAHNKVVLTLAPTATAGFTFNVNPDNPFLTANQKAIFFANPAALNDGSGVADDPTAVAGSLPLGIRRRVTETGGRVENFKNEAWQIVGGLRGDIFDTFKWEVFGQYAQTKRHLVLENDLFYPRVVQAIDAVAGPNGTVVCRDPSNGCVPLNVFSTGTLDPAAISFVSANALQDDKTTELVAGGSLTGDVAFLKSPFASKPAAIAVGVEYRRETGVTRVDDNFASGNLIYYGQGQNVGPNSYNVKEGYIEVKLPIISDRPFFQQLNLEGAFRYSDYSTVGSVYTYKGGGDWTPVEGLRLRGLYQRAVRAPNINELYAPTVGGTGSLNTDPCAGSNPVGNATLTALCVSTGVPANLIGNVAQPISGQVNVIVGGNPNLTEEKSDTYTAGIVIAPPQLKRFSLSVDYYQIKIANAISTFGGSPANIVNSCYNVDQDAASPFCAALRRNPASGQLSGPLQFGIFETNANIAQIKSRGIDIAAGYNVDVGEKVKLGFSLNGTYTLKYTVQGDPTQDASQCAGRFSSSCNLNPIPKWKHVADFTFGYDNISFLTRWRYVGKVRDDVDAIQVNRIKAFNYIDETVTVGISEAFDFRLGVQNAFDKKPPIVGGTVGIDFNAGNTFPNVYDVLGRTVFAGVSAKF